MDNVSVRQDDGDEVLISVSVKSVMVRMGLGSEMGIGGLGGRRC